MKPQGLYVNPHQFVRFAEPEKRSLADHIATRNRSPDFSAMGMYLPNPDPILKKLGKDISVYSNLRSSAHVGGCIRRRKAGVVKMEWRVVRDQASVRMHKIAEKSLKALDMRRVMREMLDAPLLGWQPMEVIWSSGGGPLLPLDVLAKPAQWFLFDTEAQLRFKSRSAPLVGELLAARKFLVPAQDASYANPYGFADLSMCVWPDTFLRGGLKFWVTFTEKYGTPFLVGKTPRGTPKAEQEALLDQLEDMVQDAVAVIPDDSSVHTVEAAAVAANADLYERLLMYCRSEISIALLGQNQTTEATANLASATAGAEVESSLRDGDARLIESSMNQLLRWMTDLNEGDGANAPRFELFEQEEVDKQQAERDGILTKAGAKLTRKYWMKTYSLDEEDIEEAPVEPPPPVVPPATPVEPVPPVTQARPGVAFAEADGPAPDALDALVDSELSEWQALMDPLVSPVQAAIDESVQRGETAAELVARLPAVLGAMSVDALHQALTRTAFTARLGAVAGLVPDGDDDVPAAAFAEPVAVAPAPSGEVHFHHTIYLPAAAPPVIHATIQVPEQQPAVVHTTVQVHPTPINVMNEVQPAGVTVLNQHPARAEQVVERDANDEIVKTVTTYLRDDVPNPNQSTRS